MAVKRILFLKDLISVPTNGAEINFYRLHNALVKDGFDVTYLAFDPVIKIDFYLNYFKEAGYKITENSNSELKYTIHDVPIIINKEVPFNRNDLLHTKHIKAHIQTKVDQIKPDIIFCYQTDYVALEAALETGLPVITFLTDNEFIRPESISKHPFGNKIKQLIHDKNQFYSALSTFLKSSFENSWGMPCAVLYGLIPPSEYEVKLDPKASLYGMVNTAAHKGFPLFALLAESYPDKEFSVLVNSVPNNEQLKAYAKVVLEIPNLSMQGPYLDPRVFYSQLKALFVPSQWEEAYGRVAVEAALSGIPVIASNKGGLPEALNGGGLILKPPVIKAEEHVPLEELIHQNKEWFLAFEMLQDPEEYRTISERTKKAALDTIEKINKSYTAFKNFLTIL